MKFTGKKYVVTTAGDLRYGVGPEVALFVFNRIRKQYPNAELMESNKGGKHAVTLSYKAPHSDYPELGMAKTLVFHANTY